MPAEALKKHLRDQFHYTRWANRQLLDALADLHGAPPERTLALLSHLLRTQQVWLGRIRGRSDLPAFWKTDTLPECRARAEASAEAWLAFLHDCAPEDFTRTVRYENSKGTPFSNELREICGHVVNHSTHHRAQIATLIREAGGVPPATDYIFYARAD